jgi:Zn-dependent protease
MPDPFYQQQPQPQPLQPARPQPPANSLGQRLKQFFAPILILLKFGLPMLKMGGSMIFALVIYSMAFGWQFAVGFIILLFIHEMGHLIAAKIVGLKVTLPLFIPFLGAVIALREAPRNAWIEAIIGIGGPLLGSIGAFLVACGYFLTGKEIFLVLGYTGMFLNLFNLIPIVPLDGGRIVSAISPWLWVLGLLIMVPYLIFRASMGGAVNGTVSFVILLIVLTSFPRVIALFRKRTQLQMRYYECTPTQRCVMALLYFSLLASLYLGMGFIKNLMPPGAF